MTEKDAIKIIKEEKSWESDNRKIDAFIIAIDSLEEIQKYREIGAVSELQDLVIGINALADSQFSAADMAKLVNDMKSLYEYRQIGTPEECRAAVEKQKAKKVMRNKTMNIYFCPVCERRVNYMHTLYCSGCGQKLDWSDEE